MFKLNTQRTYKYPVVVNIFDGDKEQTGKFTAVFKVMKNSAIQEAAAAGDKNLLDMVLMDVEGIQVDGEDGKPLAGEALLSALKDDPSVAIALAAAYNESLVKKNRPRT